MVMPAIGLVYLIAAPTSLRRRLLHLLGAAGGVPGLGGLVRRADAAVAGVVAALHRRLDRQQLHEPGPRLQRLRPRRSAATTAAAGQPHRRRRPRRTPVPGATTAGSADPGARRRGWPGCSPASSASRSAGCCPPRCWRWCWCSSRAARAPRTDLVRAGAILFGGWMLVDGLVLSYMSGTIHPYYCLSLAPAVAGMFAIGVHEMWTPARRRWFGRIGLAALIARHRGVELVDPGPQRAVAARAALGDPGADRRRGRRRCCCR